MPLAFIDLQYADFSVWLLSAFLVIGLVSLTFGGDWLTQGAAAISVNLKINPVVVGLTVVSMATSMPELVTSLLAAKESPGLAIGNILGSNVANISLILGVTALIAPMAIQLRLIRREVPILIGVTVLFTCFAVGGFARWEGIVLLTLTFIYLAYVIRGARSEPDAVNAEFLEEVEEASHISVAKASWLVFLGAALLALGADTLVGSSVELASRMGISDALIGLTIVAIGTSLPELAASVAAARSGHSDICAGNIVGSNLFNLLLIGGCVSTLVPFPVEPILFKVEFPAVILLTTLLLWFFKTGHVVSRREGLVLLLLYFSVLSLSAFSQLGYLF
ncbi:calcium/sodium antiporter [Coraliomargarita sinensis]|uniref:Calcium/sodium antiporter n=1 Tax=Coraliomargarita sinensis TaxID=2174842 RepID=A0A317ZEX8_9BACT|nr:calcium/sodium antiporter [Coraliomargarita sinensis]PXA03946.1 calcium/sodium antiporter [Coraliomargarita sinensis]